jgi:GNAT superfamily N-acetyltransferase
VPLEQEDVMSVITLDVNPPVMPTSVPDLREAVGWSRMDSDYPAAFRGYWATVVGHDEQGRLVAWCAILSDGVRHAVLLDVIVHPEWQGQGIGGQLVRTALAHVRAHGITIVHVDFLPERRGFYERCGFRTGLGGILELTVER